MSGPVRIAVAGALGRMGQAVVATAAGRTGVEVSARFDTPDAAGKGGLVSAEAALETCDVVIDFTTPAASTALARQAAERGAPALVIGATGFSAAEERVVRAAAKRIAIVKSGNFSLGLNVLIGLVRAGAATLPAHLYDIEIAETHHRRKIDAPSGTALMLGEAAAEGRGMDLSKVSVRGRDGIGGARADGQIGFASLRGGGVVGEHSVMFAAEDEILTLSHSARDRSLFARGAVEAALWAAGRAPGLYDMQDVLGFSKSE